MTDSWKLHCGFTWLLNYRFLRRYFGKGGGASQEGRGQRGSLEKSFGGLWLGSFVSCHMLLGFLQLLAVGGVSGSGKERESYG